MPSKEIDYSNTVFYKIYCKDDSVKDLYVGHTTDFNKRKRQHKRSCISGENRKVYKCIRENGGWNNWEMLIIGYKRCENLYDARRIEQEYFESLEATLNSVEPLAKASKKIISCPKEQMSSANTPQQSSHKYSCINCNYHTNSKRDYNKHLSTRKHILTHERLDKINEGPKFSCNKCGKVYTARNSLWYHERKCKEFNKNLTSINKVLPSILLELKEQNKKLNDFISELMRTKTENNIL